MKTLLHMTTVLSFAGALAIAPSVSHAQLLSGTGQVAGGVTGSVNGTLGKGLNTRSLGGDLSGTLDSSAKARAQSDTGARAATLTGQTARNAKTDAGMAFRQSAHLADQSRGAANVTGSGIVSNDTTITNRLNTIIDAQAQAGVTSDVAPSGASAAIAKSAHTAASDTSLNTPQAGITRRDAADAANGTSTDVSTQTHVTTLESRHSKRQIRHPRD